MTTSREVSGRLIGLAVTGSAVALALAAFVAYRLSRDPAKAGREPTTWDEAPAACEEGSAVDADGGVCAPAP